MHAEDKKIRNESVLAHQITRAYDTLRHGPSRGTSLLIGGAVVVVLAAVLFRYFYRSSEAATSHRWVQLDEVILPEELTSLAENAEFADTPQGRILRFKEARLLLAQGLRDLASSPARGRENVEKGTGIYEKLAASAGRVPLLHQEALGGSAKGFEALGEIDKARSFYERLARDYPQSAAGKDAAKQVQRLDSPAGKKDVSELSRILAPADR